MEEMRQIALAYYNNGSEDVKRLALEFFNSMDNNGDNRISLGEFLAFMRQEGYSGMNNPYFFHELKKDGSGNHLCFQDVLTLYYIVKSGRRFCGGCGVFLKGLYFTCVKCFSCESSRFSVCFACFSSGQFVHDHANFLDNYALLEAMSKNNSAAAESSPAINKKNKLRITELGASPSSLALVPAQTNKKKAAFKALEVGVNIRNIASNLCSIL